MATVHCPGPSRSAGVRTDLVLHVVVDTAGRPVAPTIRELWPDDLPKPRGSPLRHYARRNADGPKRKLRPVGVSCSGGAGN